VSCPIDQTALTRLADMGRAAGAVAMSHYHSEVVVDSKADASPVTAADLGAEVVIVDSLTQWTPGIPIVSEERAIPPFAIRQGWAEFWLVDPLDGTKEFIRRNGEFTVNIALIRDRRPVLGMVYAPAEDVLYVAGEGIGSWRSRGGGVPERIASTKPAADDRIVVESRSHPSDDLERYLANVPVSRRIRAGSSVKFCLVAEGSADLYPRFGPTMEWDVAAGDCVWRHATWGVPNPSPLTYNKPDLKNPSFVIGWMPGSP